MKKTCDSRVSHDGRLCVCDAESGINAHEKDDPACGKLRLDVARLMEAANNSLHKAREKHPDFVPLPPFHWGNQLLYTARQYKWRVQDGKGELQEVLLSECYEFMSALAVGDFRHALEEAGDVVAVLYRALNGEGKKEVSHE